MRRFKKIMKWLGLTVGVILVLGGAFIAHSWYFKPVNINIFFARAFLQVALESPEMLSSIHVLEQFGIKGHNAELDDDSMAAGDRLFDHLKRSRETLLSYEDEKLSEADAMSKRVAMNLMDSLVKLEKLFTNKIICLMENNFRKMMIIILLLEKSLKMN